MHTHWKATQKVNFVNSIYSSALLVTGIYNTYTSQLCDVCAISKKNLIFCDSPKCSTFTVILDLLLYISINLIYWDLLLTFDWLPNKPFMRILEALTLALLINILDILIFILMRSSPFQKTVSLIMNFLKRWWDLNVWWTS